MSSASQDRPEYLQHHFHTVKQQLSAAKLGMWIFLATEVLFFGGLFVTYGIFRNLYPEVFLGSHYALNWVMGSINTLVLLSSSLSMALAVRAAQTGEAKKSAALILFTILCAFGFMVIKYLEYTHKIEHGIVPFEPFWPTDGIGTALSPEEIKSFANEAYLKDFLPSIPVEALETKDIVFAANSNVEHYVLTAAEAQASAADFELIKETFDPQNSRIFFGLYFFMTGLHGVHVIIGVGVLTWILIGTVKGKFSPDYYTPVENVGLYWHIVDLVWIFLFPLLYLVK